jgi:hypothetical protein
MGWDEFLNFVHKLGLTEIPVWVIIGLLAYGAAVWRAAWSLRGHIDDAEIRALKAQLSASQERLDGHIAGLKAQLDARDKRLLLAHDRQEELTQKLTVATETIAQLQKQMSDGELSKAAQTIEAVRLAVQRATTANTALGSSLAGPASVLFPADSHLPGILQPPIQPGKRVYNLRPQARDHGFQRKQIMSAPRYEC